MCEFNKEDVIKIAKAILDNPVHFLIVREILIITVITVVLNYHIIDMILKILNMI